LESEENMLGILKRAGIVQPRAWCGESTEMERFFSEATEHQLDVFIVLGGDGTIKRAAEVCTETAPFLIPLPGGTMNMLSRALYGDISWEEALKNTLTAPSEKVLSGGRIRDRRFFVAAIIGAPALWAESRESVREGDIVDAFEKGRAAFQEMFDAKLQYFISGGTKGEAEAIALICPLISEEMSDSEQSLETAVIDIESAAEVIGLATSAAFGKWRDDRNVLLTKAKRVRVQSGRDIPAMLDGENVGLGTSAVIDFVSRAVKVLVPAK